jgi:hypothetical protein
VLRILPLIVLVALAHAGCGGKEAEEPRKPATDWRKTALTECRDAEEQFEELGQHILVSSVDPLSLRVTESLGRVERAARAGGGPVREATAAQHAAARRFEAAVADRDLERVRSEATALQRAGAQAAEALKREGVDCGIGITREHVEVLTAPFWVQIVEDAVRPLNEPIAAIWVQEKTPDEFAGKLERASEAIGGVLRRVEAHPIPAPVRKVGRRYLAALSDFRRACALSASAVRAGSDVATLERLLGRVERTHKRMSDALIDVTTRLLGEDA